MTQDTLKKDKTEVNAVKAANIVTNFPSAILSEMKNNPKNPLSGVISDPAFDELLKIRSQAMQRAAKVLIADLDVADGKADGVLHKETLLKKAGKLATIFGLSEDVVKDKMKQLPDTLQAADLNAGVARVVGNITHPKVIAQTNLPKVQSGEKIELPR